ncbi:SH3 domain-binding protein 2 isoform X2 [Rhinichthys klamathensis goyatoka]|uniref:SH3 domain-binding protein 2 isoform X2 n=1 Tax=Rhinichthys klamathensis goyatoka TaxID=3034132 RepID=UPI0024B61AE0|nr:SH3 domain-binding protein 2 isoform X2 [Rhinichthys klamathensis goyatoka]
MSLRSQAVSARLRSIGPEPSTNSFNFRPYAKHQPVKHGDKNKPVRMALSMNKKRSFSHLQQSHAKMCIQDFCNKNMAATAVSWPVPMRAIGAQNLLTMPGGVTSSGYLHKKGGSQFSLMKWPLRFIIIHKGCLYYFKSSTSATPQGAFSLNGYNRVLRAAEETTSSNVFPFKIVHFSKRHRTWYFSAASEDERRKWMKNLRKEINYYNDKRDVPLPSDDSDSESIYGQLEEPLEISPVEYDFEADYMTQDEDSDGEDGSPTSAGRTTVPPPPYPPPPVPFQPSRDTRHTKGPPPPLPPPFKKPVYSAKGPPPPLPYAPHLEKPDSHLSTRCPVGPIPPLPPPNSMKTMSGPFRTMPVCEKKPNAFHTGNTSATLPIIENLQKVILNSGSKASQHLTVKSTPEPRPVSPHLSSAHSRSVGQIPKPPLPTKPKPSRPSFQASPDGQSFRSSIEENPLKKRVPSRISEDSDDDDYENVQLPPSVFVDTLETNNVERIFKETYNLPQNGLYCIRKSGTGKTTQVLVVWDTGINKARNYRLFEEEQRVYLETDLTFPTLSALIEYYHINPLPSSNNSLPNYSLCLHIPYGYIPPR